MIFLLYAGINTAWAGAILFLAVWTGQVAWMAFACCGPLLFMALSWIREGCPFSFDDLPHFVQRIYWAWRLERMRRP